MQEDRGICFLLKEMSTQLVKRQRGGEGNGGSHGEGMLGEPRWEAGWLKIVFAPARCTVLSTLSI